MILTRRYTIPVSINFGTLSYLRSGNSFFLMFETDVTVQTCQTTQQNNSTLACQWLLLEESYGKATEV